MIGTELNGMTFLVYHFSLSVILLMKVENTPS